MMQQNLTEKAEAMVSYGTSAGVGTSAAFISGPGQWVLFGIALLIGIARLGYDSLKLYRLWKNKKAL